MAYSPLTLEFEFRGKRFKDAERGLKAFAGVLNADWQEAAVVLRRELETYMHSIARAVETRHSAPWPGGTTAKTLSLRTGAMIKSITESVRVSGTTYETLQGTIGGSFIARVHERGATITVRKAKYLTIPLPPALDKRGVPIRPRARDWPDTFVIKSKTGNLLIVMRKGGRIVPLYVLKKTVKIPPRLGLGDTARAGLPYFTDRAMDQMVKSILASKKVA
jgi:hypothetical protein